VRVDKNIGIVGGGIAAAVALRQVGIDVVVYEKAPRLREVGAGMMLWPNATRVLREMGLLENILARSGPNTHFLVRTSRGKILMNIALGQFDVPAVCTRRSDLLGVLLAALPSECVRLGCEVIGSCHPRNIVVTSLLSPKLIEHNLRRIYAYET